MVEWFEANKLPEANIVSEYGFDEYTSLPVLIKHKSSQDNIVGSLPMVTVACLIVENDRFYWLDNGRDGYRYSLEQISHWANIF